MRIEDAVKLSKFRNEKQKAIINIYYTNSIITGKLKEVLKPYKITPQQFNILRILKGQFPKAVRTGIVKERLVDRNSDVTRLVERLINKNLVSRENYTGDKRQMHIKINENGLNLLAKLDQLIIDFEDGISVMDNSKLEQLNLLLDHLREGRE